MATTVMVSLEIPVNLLDKLNEFCLENGISADVNIKLGVTKLNTIKNQPIVAASHDMPRQSGIFKKAQAINNREQKIEIDPDLSPPRKPPIMGTEDSMNPSLEDEINMIMYNKALEEWKIKTGRKEPPKIDEFSERELAEAMGKFGVENKNYSKKTLGEVLKSG